MRRRWIDGSRRPSSSTKRAQRCTPIPSAIGPPAPLHRRFHPASNRDNSRFPAPLLPPPTTIAAINPRCQNTHTLAAHDLRLGTRLCPQITVGRSRRARRRQADLLHAARTSSPPTSICSADTPLPPPPTRCHLRRSSATAANPNPLRHREERAKLTFHPLPATCADSPPSFSSGLSAAATRKDTPPPSLIPAAVSSKALSPSGQRCRLIVANLPFHWRKRPAGSSSFVRLHRPAPIRKNLVEGSNIFGGFLLCC